MRPDVHRPSEIVPNDYEFVACEDVRGEDFDNALFGQSERQRIHDRSPACGLERSCGPCPTGRIVVTRKVLSTRGDTPFGYVVKMLVRDDSGFKVWCSCPSAASIAKGNRISMRASVTPSRDDTKFGFGKRPSNLEVLAALPAAA